MQMAERTIQSISRNCLHVYKNHATLPNLFYGISDSKLMDFHDFQVMQ